MKIKQCVRHTYKLVNNPYKNGKLSTKRFEGIEWRSEKVCEKCGATLLIDDKQK